MALNTNIGRRVEFPYQGPTGQNPGVSGTSFQFPAFQTDTRTGVVQATQLDVSGMSTLIGGGGGGGGATGATGPIGPGGGATGATGPTGPAGGGIGTIVAMGNIQCPAVGGGGGFENTNNLIPIPANFNPLTSVVLLTGNASDHATNNVIQPSKSNIVTMTWDVIPNQGILVHVQLSVAGVTGNYALVSYTIINRNS